MSAREDITAAITKLLSDGQWHEVADIGATIAAAAPPGGAMDVGFWMGPICRAGICERFGEQRDPHRKYRLLEKADAPAVPSPENPQ